MSKRVFLYVYGDDYSALHFDQEYDKQELYESMVNKNEKHRIIETDEFYIEIKIKEFGEIDDTFVQFIRDYLCDSDDLKNADIFEVKQIKH